MKLVLIRLAAWILGKLGAGNENSQVYTAESVVVVKTPARQSKPSFLKRILS
jgi:hypothetical protein